jgi:hypothetical protein
MKKNIVNFEMDYYIEKAVKRYCRENSISMDQFMEDAVLDRLEAGEYERSRGDFDEEYREAAENMIFEAEGDFYKKKH